MLKGRTALVTGSTSGIGLSIAEGLASVGCNVVLNGLGEAQGIEAARQKIEKTFQVKALYHPANMCESEAIEDLVGCAIKKFGSLDILVNNAGIQYTAPVDEFPVDQWNSIIAINLSSVFHSTRCTVPHMRKQNWGRIINIASVHGLVASVDKAAYVAAKHGVVGLTKVVALELAESGITCNAICPGWVRTPLVEAQIAARADAHGTNMEQAAAGMLGEKQPSKRFVEASEIAQLCIFLAGDAAQNITGVTLPIDGGWVAR